MFDFNRVSDQNLEARLKGMATEVKMLKRQLNGPPIKCDAEVCNRVEADRDRLRLGHDSDGKEIVVCKECGSALYRHGVNTAPFGAVKRSDLERAETALSAMKVEIEKRAKRAIAEAEHERKLESSGFFDRFKKREEGNGADPEPMEPTETGAPEGQTAH